MAHHRMRTKTMDACAAWLPADLRRPVQLEGLAVRDLLREILREVIAAYRPLQRRTRRVRGRDRQRGLPSAAETTDAGEPRATATNSAVCRSTPDGAYPALFVKGPISVHSAW
jgi:hypothetical protein